MRFLILIVIIFFGFQSHGASKSFGLGLQLGDPTGITGKYILNKKNSISGAIGSNNGRLNINGVYLWEVSKIFKLDTQPVDFVFGVGGRLKEKNDKGDDELNVGVRAPAQLKMQFKRPSLDLFVEIAGTMNITPDTDFDVNLSLGSRYFF